MAIRRERVKVRLISATAPFPWTEKLVGETGEVVETRGKAMLVSGLMPGDALWFTRRQLEDVEDEAA